MTQVLGRGLYGILDLPIDTAAAPDAPSPQKVYEALFGAGLPAVQLRMKGADAAAMLAMLKELRAHRGKNTLLIVNDRLDVAIAGGADGVHLGQDDLPLSAARRMVKDCGRSDFLIGISTHNEEQAAAALQGGADYIALGPIYPTTSKKNPDPVVGVQRLSALCRISTVPVVAIGGITLERVPAIVSAGAHCAAIISAVNKAPSILATASKVQQQFTDC